MKKFSKLLCILLTLALLFSFMSIGVFAADTTSNDTGSTTIDISNVKDLIDILEKIKGGSPDSTDPGFNFGFNTGDIGSLINELDKILNKGDSNPDSGFNFGFDSDTISSLVDELTKIINSGNISNIGDDIKDKIDSIINGSNGEPDPGFNFGIDADTVASLIDELDKILNKGDSSIDSDTISSIVDELTKIINSGNISNIGDDIKDKIDTSVIEDLLGKLDKIINGSGNNVDPGFNSQIEAILEYLASLMGDDIEDEATPLAGTLTLNDTDHFAYIKGRSYSTFAPTETLTRAEAAQMLYGLLTDDCLSTFKDAKCSFSDVPSNAWYYKAVCVLSEGGAINGYPNGTFRPNGSITRAEFITMVVAMYGTLDGAKSPFTDVPANAWYYDSAATAYTMGWVSGYGDGTYRGNTNITRAEAVTFLNNVLGRNCDMNYVSSHLSSIRLFSDVCTACWYFPEVTEAANGHDYTKASNGAETWTNLK